MLYTKHQAIEMQVTRGEIDAGADYNRNRDAMISEGLIKAPDSVVFWTSDPLPNVAVAVRAELARDAAFVARLRAALVAVGPESTSGSSTCAIPPSWAWSALLPVHFDGPRWQREFLAQWPVGSPAWTSYFERITHGPAFSPEQAVGR